MAENDFVSREISVANGKSIRISINIPFKLDEMEWRVDFSFSDLLASKSGHAFGVDAFGALINALSKIRYILFSTSHLALVHASVIKTKSMVELQNNNLHL